MPTPAPAGNAAVPHKHEQEHAPEPPVAIIEPVPESIVELVEVAAGAATAAVDDATEEATGAATTAIDDAAEATAGAAAADEDEAMLLAIVAIAIPAVPFCCIAICMN